MTGCLRPTPTEFPPVYADIPPAELRRRQATLRLARRALDPNHQLSHKVTSPELKQSQRLKSRQRSTISIQPKRHQGGRLGRILMELRVEQSPHPTTSLRQQLRYPSPGVHLPRHSWVRLNHLRTDDDNFVCLYSARE